MSIEYGFEIDIKDGKVIFSIDKALLQEALQCDEIEEEKTAATVPVEYKAYNDLLNELDSADGVDLFEEREGIGGELKDAPKAKEKLEELVKWLEKNKFSEGEFLRYLTELTEVAGWPLSAPLVKYKTDPQLFGMAYRYFTYWKGHQDQIAKEYKAYVLKFAKEILEGE